MAAQSDVEDALVQLCATALYPGGVSAVGATARIFRGWPNLAALEADLAAGRVNVTIFPVPGATRITTRYAPDWLPDPVPPTLTVAVAGATAIFAGTAELGQVAGVLCEGRSFVHRTADGDSPALVAAILAAAIVPVRPALATGATLCLPGAASLIARTAADAHAALELRRQQQAFRVTAWCPSPALRDAACDALDVAVAATPFLTLPGGTAARLRAGTTTTFDQRQDAALFRRDINVTVEFPTTQVAIQPSMLFGVLSVGAITITA